MSDLDRSLDDLLKLLADRRRRYVLYYLDDAEDDVVTLDELSDHVADRREAWSANTDGTGVVALERVRVGLHHNHLPRLADAGLIDYDGRTQTVRNWREPALMDWAQPDQDEFPHLRALFSTSVTG